MLACPATSPLIGVPLASSTVTDGFSTGFGVGERVHPYNTGYNLADVFGGGAIAPWSTMIYETLDVQEVLPGLINTNTSNPESGQFSAVM